MKKFGLKSVTATTFISCALAVTAQIASPSLPDMLQQQAHEMEQAETKNEQRLHTYQWVESTTLTIHGRLMPAEQSICTYAVDGTLFKTPLGSQEAPSELHGLKKHIVEKKKEEIQADVEEIQAVMQLYLPFNRMKFKEVLLNGKIALEHDGTKRNVIVLINYAKQGDQLRLTLNSATMQIDRISVTTYFDEPKDAMNVDVHFAILPDGTVYPAVTSIEAPSKKLSIATVNSDFSKAASAAATPPAGLAQQPNHPQNQSPASLAKQTPEQLQQLVAPIALYPDELVAEVIAAATDPTEVVMADRWLREHKDLQGKQLADEVDRHSGGGFHGLPPI
jgi:hypothetical protein